MQNPDDFIITRKRKKYKFAKFANSPLCFEVDQWQKQAVDVLEIGAGTGLFSVELAQRHPELQFVAIDVKGDRLQTGAYEATRLGLANVRFVRARADQVDQIVPEKSLQQIWVTFADPYPKKRSAGRRMTHPTFLRLYERILRGSGSLCIKHDNPVFFAWTLEQLVAEEWILDELTFDLHDSEVSDDYKVLTTYEKRWLGEGLKTQLVTARKI